MAEITRTLKAPLIDSRVLRMGVSRLREVNSEWLNKFAENGEIAVLQTSDEPLAVLVPYKMYQEMSALLGSGTPGDKPQTESWEPSGKCQLNSCDGTKFDYDSTDSRYGSWFCTKCGGMQLPPSALTGEPHPPQVTGSVEQATIKLRSAIASYANLEPVQDALPVAWEAAELRIDATIRDLILAVQQSSSSQEQK